MNQSSSQATQSNSPQPITAQIHHLTLQSPLRTFHTSCRTTAVFPSVTRWSALSRWVSHRTRFRSSIPIHASVYSFTMHIYRAPGALRSSPPISFSPTFRSATASVYLGRKGLYTSNPSRSLVCLCVSDTVFLPVSRSASVVCLLCSNCFMYCTITVTCCPRRPSSALCIHHFTRSLARPFALRSVRSTPQTVHRKPPIACCAPVVDRWPSGHLSTLLALSPRCLPRARFRTVSVQARTRGAFFATITPHD